MPGQTRVKRQPQRTCIACRSVNAKRGLVRIVRTPAGEVLVDATGKRPGRGAYVCARRACWRVVLAGPQIAHALHVELTPEQRVVLEIYAGQLPEDAPAVS